MTMKVVCRIYDYGDMSARPTTIEAVCRAYDHRPQSPRISTSKTFDYQVRTVKSTTIKYYSYNYERVL